MRDLFRYSMGQYKVALMSGIHISTTLPALKGVDMPTIMLSFEGGASLELGIEQMMYFSDPHNIFFMACLDAVCASSGGGDT